MAHDYHFVVFALDAELNLKPGLNRAELHEVMTGHIIGRGELVVWYRRENRAVLRTSSCSLVVLHGSISSLVAFARRPSIDDGRDRQRKYGEQSRATANYFSPRPPPRCDRPGRDDHLRSSTISASRCGPCWAHLGAVAVRWCGRTCTFWTPPSLRIRNAHSQRSHAG